MRISSIISCLATAVLIAGMFSCTKEKDFLYEVDDIKVQQANTGKGNLKSNAEFISIAYTDLFGSAINQSDLVKLNRVYSAFGDRKLIEDRIIRNFLNDPSVQVPAVPSVAGDTSQFIINTFKKLYNRVPGAFEEYYLKEQIRLNASMTPVVIYYALMTSDEYRFY